MGRKSIGPYFRFVNRDDPNYEPNYGNTFTERQLAILEGKVPLSEVRVNELTVLKRKAFQMVDMVIFEMRVL